MTIVPNEEQRILGSLITLRNKLTILKRVGVYHNQQEILAIYTELNLLCNDLLTIRQTTISSHSTLAINTANVEASISNISLLSSPSQATFTYRNRVDDVIDDNYQLLSLFWMALGKIKESPAIYIQLVSIQQCLDHLCEFGVYTLDDILPFKDRIKYLTTIINTNKEKNNETSILEKLVSKKLYICQELINKLVENINDLDLELIPIQKRLVQIKNELAIEIAMGGKDIDKIKKMHKELREIDAKRVEGKFISEKTNSPMLNQTSVVGMLKECFEDCHEITTTKEYTIKEDLKPIFDRLVSMKNELTCLYITRRWTMRETDLWVYQVQLGEIDSMRNNDGNFVDENDNHHEGQSIIHFLLQKCYRIIYKLLVSSEPIAEPLIPIHNQLLTLRRCLNEVKSWGGPYTIRELYPYQIKLNSIDSLRKDGKFLDDDGFVPEGQAVVMALLNECYDILCEMKDYSGNESSKE